MPNVSEGRRPDVIEEIARAVRQVPLVRLLDVSADFDHNRTVYTLIGPPQPVAKGAFMLVKRALELIDIEKHDGVHPYIGAVDVVPFIPICGVKREDVVELARSFGDRLAHDLKLPVYFYGYAALRHDRVDLPDVRRGGYVKLKEEITTILRHPDYGDAKLHPRGGAAAVGVRDFLIAFNVNLRSNDLEAAKDMARSIREKHGGLPGVRAIGVPLKSRGIVQVSMNITDHRETTLKEVMDTLTKKAAAKGIDILEGEIIGLVPKDSVFPNMKEYLKLKSFDGRNIVNNYL